VPKGVVDGDDDYDGDSATWFGKQHHFRPCNKVGSKFHWRQPLVQRRFDDSVEFVVVVDDLDMNEQTGLDGQGLHSYHRFSNPWTKMGIANCRYLTSLNSC